MSISSSMFAPHLLLTGALSLDPNSTALPGGAALQSLIDGIGWWPFSPRSLV